MKPILAIKDIARFCFSFSPNSLIISQNQTSKMPMNLLAKTIKLRDPHNTQIEIWDGLSSHINWA